MKNLLHRRRLVPVAVVLASVGLTIANGPAVAQQKPAKWTPDVETITVRAAPIGDLRGVLRGATFGDVFMAVSASIAVPYSDLDLASDPGARELVRRINVAARLVCVQLDIKYPPSQYPVVEGEPDCAQTAAKDAMSQVNFVMVASAEK